ncbi:hypothetical protein HKX48_000230 [Thoreauomyces humboldtii]|nr:hypothetical protein HKX48_000230 [Thoreauomyces humboldtii]
MTDHADIRVAPDPTAATWAALRLDNLQNNLRAATELLERARAHQELPSTTLKLPALPTLPKLDAQRKEALRKASHSSDVRGRETDHFSPDRGNGGPKPESLVAPASILQESIERFRDTLKHQVGIRVLSDPTTSASDPSILQESANAVTQMAGASGLATVGNLPVLQQPSIHHSTVTSKGFGTEPRRKPATGIAEPSLPASSTSARDEKRRKLTEHGKDLFTAGPPNTSPIRPFAGALKVPVATDLTVVEESLFALDQLQERMQTLNQKVLRHQLETASEQTEAIQRQAMKHMYNLQELQEKQTDWQISHMKRMQEFVRMQHDVALPEPPLIRQLEIQTGTEFKPASSPKGPVAEKIAQSHPSVLKIGEPRVTVADPNGSFDEVKQQLRSLHQELRGLVDSAGRVGPSSQSPPSQKISPPAPEPVRIFLEERIDDAMRDLATIHENLRWSPIDDLIQIKTAREGMSADKALHVPELESRTLVPEPTNEGFAGKCPSQLDSTYSGIARALRDCRKQSSEIISVTEVTSLPHFEFEPTFGVGSEDSDDADANSGPLDTSRIKSIIDKKISELEKGRVRN